MRTFQEKKCGKKRMPKRNKRYAKMMTRSNGGKKQRQLNERRFIMRKNVVLTKL